MSIISAAYDYGLMRQFMALFPMSPMALLLGGYFSYIGVPISNEEDHPLVLEDDLLEAMNVRIILRESYW
jgi:hypothetical protein